MTRSASLAFCNDIDFADWATFCEVHRCLYEEFGIDSDESFWLFDPAGSEMSLFKSSLSEKSPKHDELLDAVSQGRLSVLHALGNFDSVTATRRPCRALFAEGLWYLREKAKVPSVWTNHGDTGNIQNIGWPKCSYQQGDDPSSDVYIADLLRQHGVRYYWTDRHCTNDFICGRTPKDAQPILRMEATRSGWDLCCFLRYRGALPKAPDAETLAKQITDEHLDALEARRGVVVIYQHWCVHRDAEGRPHTAGRPVFPAESRRALAKLASRRDRNSLRLCRIGELLDECRPIPRVP